jgi:uncharacterized membrane protein YgcG
MKHHTIDTIFAAIPNLHGLFFKSLYVVIGASLGVSAHAQISNQITQPVIINGATIGSATCAFDSLYSITGTCKVTITATGWCVTNLSGSAVPAAVARSSSGTGTAPANCVTSATVPFTATSFCSAVDKYNQVTLNGQAYNPAAGGPKPPGDCKKPRTDRDEDERKKREDNDKRGEKSSNGGDDRKGMAASPERRDDDRKADKKTERDDEGNDDCRGEDKEHERERDSSKRSEDSNKRLASPTGSISARSDDDKRKDGKEDGKDKEHSGQTGGSHEGSGGSNGGAGGNSGNTPFPFVITGRLPCQQVT